MKEQRIINFIGLKASMILANTIESNFKWFWVASCLFYTISYLKVNRNES